MKRLFEISIFLPFLLTASFSFGQLSSVFDANYFSNDNLSPPIKIGKGFNINDVYKQTRSCFTTESANPNKLTSQQTGGKKTSIRLYYTRTNEEFNKYKSHGASGKISFLNLFSLGGQKLEEYSTKTILEQERIIFTANVDFGIYSFDADPQMLPDAKNLIDQGKAQDFIKLYGTHYISGIRKESNISVVLTKAKNSKEDSTNVSSSIQADGIIPFKGSGSMEVENGSWTNKLVSKNKFSVSVEINGPAIEKSEIESQISTILSGSEQDKATAISDIISGAIKNISDPSQSISTQYYYSPFSLYGLDGINWDDNKIKLLSKINESVVKVYSAKSLIVELTSESGKQKFKDELVASRVPEISIEKILDKYDAMRPVLEQLNQKADDYLKELETRYSVCADVSCSISNTCCDNLSYLNEITAYNFEKKTVAQIEPLFEVTQEVAKEMNTPECEKQQKGIITIYNLSSNPYNIYCNNKFIETLSGKTNKSYFSIIGTYNFRAEQASGYLLYATVNNRYATISSVCQEVVLRVGFND